MRTFARTVPHAPRAARCARRRRRRAPARARTNARTPGRRTNLRRERWRSFGIRRDMAEWYHRDFERGVNAGQKGLDDILCILYINSMSPPPNRSFRLPPLSGATGGPLYEQIMDALKREIAAGRLQPGDPLPSFRALAEDLLVSVITVKRAYEELEREGIIFCRQGLGTFVAEDGARRNEDARRRRAIALLQEALAEARDAGLSEAEIAALTTTKVPTGESRPWKTKR